MDACRVTFLQAIDQPTKCPMQGSPNFRVKFQERYKFDYLLKFYAHLIHRDLRGHELDRLF